MDSSTEPRAVPKDLVNMKIYQDITTSLAPDEEIVYSTHLIKINKRNLRQKRVLLLTTKYLYNIRLTSFWRDMLTTFAKSWKIIKKFPLMSIKIIGYSDQGDQFLVSAPEEYDLHYSSSARNEIIDYLFYCRTQALCGNFMTFFTADSHFLGGYVLHPDEKVTGPVRKISEDSYHNISHEEFEINFCKKNTITQNLMDTGKLSLKDFDF
jgi:hypothetical protein